MAHEKAAATRQEIKEPQLIAVGRLNLDSSGTPKIQVWKGIKSIEKAGTAGAVTFQVTFDDAAEKIIAGKADSYELVFSTPDGATTAPFANSYGANGFTIAFRPTLADRSNFHVAFFVYYFGSFA